VSKKIIVGAGLSGMTAGINLVRDGYEVEIWERGKSLGGVALDQEEKMKRPFAIADMPHSISIVFRNILVLTLNLKKKKVINLTILPIFPLHAFIYLVQNAT